MAAAQKTPIIIGVGDVVNRSRAVEDAVEPLVLILQAFKAALADTGLSLGQSSALKSRIDSVDIVRTWSWPYPDLPGLLSKRLGIRPRRKHYSEHGGNQPGYLFDEAARRISKGESDAALLAGGEALASLSACAAAKKLPPPDWTPLSEEVDSVFSPTTRELKSDLGATHSIGNPIHIYPLYEAGFRAHRKQSVSDNHTESAKLYAEFAKVAESNRYAWGYGSPAETEESIGKVTKRNRMICTPYPLLMNAFNTVNLAAAVIMTSTDHARSLGIPEDRWIYALGGAGSRDSNDFWQRPNFHSSPAISRSLDAALKVSQLHKEDIDIFDFYSCFPIVPKLACHHLGLDIVRPQKPITVLGGLTSFGGAGNNYSMHAITEMTRQLRTGKGTTGLVLANGGVVTYQSAICLSCQPRKDSSPYPDTAPLPQVITDVPVRKITERAEGEAVVETYTVEFNRDGSPLRGHVVGQLKSNGLRFLANHADEQTLKVLSSLQEEQVGSSGWVKASADGRNLFAVDSTAKL